jgi:NAD(P)H-hydrate epimerase
MPIETGYLNAKDAAALDAELMSTPGFSLEQLMELAGLAVAEAVYLVSNENGATSRKKRVLLVCG